MRGAHVRATIPVTEALLNQFLSKQQVTVEIRERNQLSIRLWVASVSLEIARIDPDLWLVLRLSWLSSQALSAAMMFKPGLRAYVRQQGGLVYINCAALPGVEQYRYLWRHVSAVRASTSRGVLFLDMELLIR